MGTCDPGIYPARGSFFGKTCDPGILGIPGLRIFLEAQAKHVMTSGIAWNKSNKFNIHDCNPRATIR